MLQSIRFWLRHKSQAVWLIAVLGMATAVATAAWSISYGLWLEPTPFRDPSRLVSVGSTSDRAPERMPFTSVLEYQDYQGATQDFLAVASWETKLRVYLARPDQVIDLHIVAATTNLLDVLGVAPALGHGFSVGDGAAVVRPAIISDRLWHTQFGANPKAIGETIHLASWLGDTTDAIIAGVLPPRVQLPFQDEVADVILATTDGVRPGESNATSRRANYERFVVGRLFDGVTVAEAESRLTPILRQIDHDHPTYPRVRTASIVPLHEYWYGRSRNLLALLASAALLVVLITGANAVGVVLMLMSRRAKELAIRGALGATRARIAAQLVVEALVIAAAAALVSITVAQGLIRAFVAWAPANIPRLDAIRIDGRAAALAVVMSVGFSLALGILPSLVRRGEIVSFLQSCGGGATTRRRTLAGRRVAIAIQIALVLALLGAAGLVSGTLTRLLQQPLGFDPARVVVTEVVPTRPYFRDRDRFQAFLDLMRRSAATAPGARATALAFDPPLGRGSMVRVDFVNGTFKFTTTKMVSDGFFDVMSIRIVAGRDFTRDDYATGDFAIVNESFARAHLGGVAAAVGSIVILGDHHDRVVGVVADVRERGLTDPLEPVIYPLLTSHQWTPGIFYIATRDSGAGSVEQAEAQLSQAVQRADPTAHARAFALEDRLAAQTALARTQAAMLGFLAIFTLGLAALGIFATIAQVVEDRRRELGIRLALGAAPHSVVGLVSRSVLAPVVAGLIGGGVLSWLVARVVRSFLFDLSPFDPATWAIAALAIVVAAGSSAWLPARRAASLDPATVLREN